MEKDALFIGRLFFMRRFCHGNDFGPVMPKPSFLKKCGIIYITERIHSSLFRCFKKIHAERQKG